MSPQRTSDGIAREDWEIIESLAAKIANAVCAESDDDAESATRQLFAQLSRLEQKYGRLASILATRADYADDPKDRINLLEEAWRSAQSTGDTFNLVLIASSLAETFIVELEDPHKGRKWLDRLETVLGDRWDEDEYAQVVELTRRLADILRPPPTYENVQRARGASRRKRRGRDVP
jgi:hypothetical protein